MTRLDRADKKATVTEITTDEHKNISKHRTRQKLLLAENSGHKHTEARQLEARLLEKHKKTYQNTLIWKTLPSALEEKVTTRFFQITGEEASFVVVGVFFFFSVTVNQNRPTLFDWPHDMNGFNPNQSICTLLYFYITLNYFYLHFKRLLTPFYSLHSSACIYCI